MRTTTIYQRPLLPNRYAGACCVCGKLVKEREGYLSKNAMGGLSIHHSKCLADVMRKKPEEKK